MTDDDVEEIVRAFANSGKVPDNAQAMELVKKFRLCLGRHHEKDRWNVYEFDPARPKSDRINLIYAYSFDLNRAIVEVVAKMQQSKVETPS